MFVLLLAGLTAGCKKGEDGPIGGKGGSGTLRITPRHHTRLIDSCTVYIKYNAVDAPIDGRYDDSVMCTAAGGVTVAEFSGLKKGNYYLYGFGWDPVLVPAQHVKGGLAYMLSSDTVQNIFLQISEGD